MLAVSNKCSDSGVFNSSSSCWTEWQGGMGGGPPATFECPNDEPITDLEVSLTNPFGTTPYVRGLDITCKGGQKGVLQGMGAEFGSRQKIDINAPVQGTTSDGSRAYRFLNIRHDGTPEKPGTVYTLAGTGAVTREDGTYQEQYCPSGTFISGLETKTGSWLDGFRFECSPDPVIYCDSDNFNNKYCQDWVAKNSDKKQVETILKAKCPNNPTAASCVNMKDLWFVAPPPIVALPPDPPKEQSPAPSLPPAELPPTTDDNDSNINKGPEVSPPPTNTEVVATTPGTQGTNAGTGKEVTATTPAANPAEESSNGDILGILPLWAVVLLIIVLFAIVLGIIYAWRKNKAESSPSMELAA